eukprot:353273-Chlamydomonas_euryale.AAC.12
MPKAQKRLGFSLWTWHTAAGIAVGVTAAEQVGLENRCHQVRHALAVANGWVAERVKRQHAAGRRHGLCTRGAA